MSALEGGWRRLGAVLVEAGLIREEDLIEALAAQELSDRRLGEILVARGLVSSAAVANALAEQHGSFFRSEHGFGTGLRSSIDPDRESAGETSEPDAPPLSNAQAPTRLGDGQADAVDSREDDGLQRPTRTGDTPERQHASAASTSAPPASTDAPESGAFKRVHPESEHLLFVPTPHGYLLLEQRGAAPAVGKVLELPEVAVTRVVVAKLTSSPLPQDRRACAYLQPL